MDSPLDRFDRAAAVASAVVDNIKDDQYDLPSPCTEWTVRNVLNHMVTGNLTAEAIVAGVAHPDRSTDRLGDDPRAAFAASLASTRAALDTPGLLDRIVSTPRGEAPGSFLILLRVNELLVHGWDLAKATGQSTDLDPELAVEAMGVWRERFGDRPRAMLPYDEPQPVPDDATAADRLAAYLGRNLGTD
jgi:uncharacterized protein (TIGR03086 family)